MLRQLTVLLNMAIFPALAASSQWCIASSSAPSTALQVALDYACGYGGADCSAIQPGAPCFNPDNVKDHASYAFNQYYQRNPVPASCVFAGTAQLTSADPTTSTCHYAAAQPTSPVVNQAPALVNQAPPVVLPPSPPSPIVTMPSTLLPTTPTTVIPTSPTVYGVAVPASLPSSAPDIGVRIWAFAIATAFLFVVVDSIFK